MQNYLLWDGHITMSSCRIMYSLFGWDSCDIYLEYPISSLPILLKKATLNLICTYFIYRDICALIPVVAGCVVVGIGWVVVGTGLVVVGIGWVVVGTGWVVVGTRWVVVGSVVVLVTPSIHASTSRSPIVILAAAPFLWTINFTALIGIFVPSPPAFSWTISSGLPLYVRYHIINSGFNIVHVLYLASPKCRQ